MIKPNFIFKVAVLFVCCFAAAIVSFAQTDAKIAAASGYDVVLQVLSGSNESGQKSAAPANLAAVVKKISSNFSFSNYRLSNTYISRVADTGSVEYKNLSNDFSQLAGQPEVPIFLDWSFTGLRNTPDAGTPNLIQIQSFRFGARVPVKANGVVVYENIGLTLQRISVPKNVPTLVGTLPTTRSDETIFLILTVKSIE